VFIVPATKGKEGRRRMVHEKVKRIDDTAKEKRKREGNWAKEICDGKARAIAERKKEKSVSHRIVEEGGDPFDISGGGEKNRARANMKVRAWGGEQAVLGKLHAEDGSSGRRGRSLGGRTKPGRTNEEQLMENYRGLQEGPPPLKKTNPIRKSFSSREAALTN